MNAAELFDAGMSLPPTERKDVALRLLESIDVADSTSVDEAWSEEIRKRLDEVLDGSVHTIPGDQVFEELATRRARRQDSHRA